MKPAIALWPDHKTIKKMLSLSPLSPSLTSSSCWRQGDGHGDAGKGRCSKEEPVKTGGEGERVLSLAIAIGSGQGRLGNALSTEVGRHWIWMHGAQWGHVVAGSGRGKCTAAGPSHLSSMGTRYHRTPLDLASQSSETTPGSRWESAVTGVGEGPNTTH